MSAQKLILVLIFIAVLYNLGAALFHMMTDKSGSGRMAKSLSWRIGLSVGMVLLVIIGILLGWIEPHGISVGK